jgi:hypothetical protein
VLIYCPYAHHNGLAHGLAGSWNWQRTIQTKATYLPHSLAAFVLLVMYGQEAKIRIQKFKKHIFEVFSHQK